MVAFGDVDGNNFPLIFRKNNSCISFNKGNYLLIWVNKFENNKINVLWEGVNCSRRKFNQTHAVRNKRYFWIYKINRKRYKQILIGVIKWFDFRCVIRQKISYNMHKQRTRRSLRPASREKSGLLLQWV